MKITKLLWILIAGFFLYTPMVDAQGADKGRVYVDLGIGLPRYSYGYYGIYGGHYGYDYSRTPALRGDIRFGINDFITAGAYVGYSHFGWRQTTNAGKYKSKYTTIPIGVGGSFHLWDFLNETLELGLGVEQLDIYGSIMAGVAIQNYNHVTPTVRQRDTDLRGFFGSTVGIRYYFSRNFGAYFETGYGILSYLNVGITLGL